MTGTPINNEKITKNKLKIEKKNRGLSSLIKINITF